MPDLAPAPTATKGGAGDSAAAVVRGDLARLPLGAIALERTGVLLRVHQVRAVEMRSPSDSSSSLSVSQLMPTCISPHSPPASRSRRSVCPRGSRSNSSASSPRSCSSSPPCWSWECASVAGASRRCAVDGLAVRHPGARVARPVALFVSFLGAKLTARKQAAAMWFGAEGLRLGRLRIACPPVGHISSGRDHPPRRRDDRALYRAALFDRRLGSPPGRQGSRSTCVEGGHPAAIPTRLSGRLITRYRDCHKTAKFRP